MTLTADPTAATQAADVAAAPCVPAPAAGPGPAEVPQPDPASLFSLRGRTVLITGASRGIGAVLAEGMARAGARVVLAARDRDRLEQVAATVRAHGAQAHVLPFDVRDQEATETACRAALDWSGGIDVLVNNAGGPVFQARFLRRARRAGTRSCD